MRKLIVVAVAAACLAIPGLAVGESHARAVDHITCGDGTALKPPFTAPVCAEHGNVASITCVSGAVLTQPLDGKRCPAAGDGDGAVAPKPQDDQGAGKAFDRHHGQKLQNKWRFSAGFLNRVWRISGSGYGYADGVLDFTADRFVGIPRRFAREDDAVVGVDARVLVTERTRIFDAEKHRLTGAAATSALDAADELVVVGKVVPKAKWQQDEDGTPVPTLRAKRIVIGA